MSRIQDRLTHRTAKRDGTDRRSGAMAIALALSLMLAACEQPTDGAVGGGVDGALATTTEAAAADSANESSTDDASPESLPMTSTTMVRSSGTQVLDFDGVPLDLKCVNIDGWLTPTPYLVSDSGDALFSSPAEFAGRLDEVVGEARADQFWNDWRDNFITEADFERMSSLGFNCARLVIYYRAIASVESGEPVFDEAGLARIDSAVDWAKQHGVYVVLDLHAAPGGQNGLSTVADVPTSDPVARLWVGDDAASNQDSTVEIWRHLAKRYANEPWVAGYDLLNEPQLPNGVDDSVLIDLYARIIEAIRSVDGGHMVILEGDDLATDVSVFTTPLDENMMYEFHAYAFTIFEHWATPEKDDLQPYLTLRAEHDRPIWLGEFGEGTQDWTVQMVNLMEANDVGWALYPWKRKQTWFWNPVVQRIDDMPKWYELADYLAQPYNGTVPVPDADAAEEAMDEVLAKVQLSANTEDSGLTKAIFDS